MSQSTATKVSRLVLGELGPRFLSNTTGFSRPATTGMSSAKFASYGVRGWSASAPSVKPSEEDKPKAFATEDGKLIVSYWGVAPPKITKEDGTAWKWNCFRVCSSISIHRCNCQIHEVTEQSLFICLNNRTIFVFWFAAMGVLQTWCLNWCEEAP